jgi:deoxyribodipyrimidine photolyase-related protein
MSDYCSHCRYDVGKRVGEDACPFNALYWDFLTRHRGKLGDNRRLALPYRNWDRQSEADQTATRAQAAAFLAKLDKEEDVSYCTLEVRGQEFPEPTAMSFS